MDMKRRSFLGWLLASVGLGAAAQSPVEAKPAVLPPGAEPRFRDADIHIGRLMEPLAAGGTAKVSSENPWPQHKGCFTICEVNAGPLVPACGLPADWPVAFVSLNRRFVTLGW